MCAVDLVFHCLTELKTIERITEDRRRERPRVAHRRETQPTKTGKYRFYFDTQKVDLVPVYHTLIVFILFKKTPMVVDSTIIS